MNKKSLQNWHGAAAVIGVDWGDSGKGRLVDDLSARADIVARYNGGSNTGHTVENRHGKFAFHIIPSGIFNERALCVIGRSVAVDMESLVDEMAALEKAKVRYNNLLIDEQASLTMPWHRMRDGIHERQRSQKIGTTGRGVGPTYADRTERQGLLVKDLFLPEFEERLKEEFDYQTETYELDLNYEQILQNYREYAQKIKSFVGKTTPVIQEAINTSKNILFEGAQGYFLDIDFGTYPFVTSSHPGVVGIWTCFGVRPENLSEVIGITKAYTTRVGEGPIPTAMEEADADYIIKVGKEVGTTTGRIRHPGWLDLVLIKSAVRDNGITSLAVTKLDVLSSMPTVKLCTGYTQDGREVDYLPHDADFLASCTPVYEQLPGWRKKITRVRKFKDLPENAKRYIERIQEVVGVPVKFISVGSRRGQVIYV